MKVQSHRVIGLKMRLVTYALAVAVAATGCFVDLGSEEPTSTETGGLQGQVCLANGAPASDAEVRITTSEGVDVLAEVFAEGQWGFASMPIGYTTISVNVGTREPQIFETTIQIDRISEVVDPHCPGQDLELEDENAPQDTDLVPEDFDPVNDDTGGIEACLCSAKEGDWLPNARVWVETESDIIETTADDGGCFLLQDIPTGSAILRVSDENYLVELEIEIPANEVVFPEYEHFCEYPDACYVNEQISASSISAPTDIILVVDSSGSMGDEAIEVQNNLNLFSEQITATGIDHHVVLIGDSNTINIPPPLGDSERFRHLAMSVGSNNALDVLLTNYYQFQDFLRPDATTHIVVISDDNSSRSAGSFMSSVSNLAGIGFSEDWVMHSVVAYGSLPFYGCWGGASIGNVYLDISEATGGIISSICDGDFSSVFSSIADAVQVSVALPCTFDLPVVPDGYTLDLEHITVTYEAANSPPVSMAQVENESSCSSMAWYMSGENDNKTLCACEDTCEILRSQGEFGDIIQINAGCYEDQ
jgi:hypothetical protein